MTKQPRSRVWLWVGVVMLAVLGGPLAAFNAFVRANAQVPEWSPSGTQLPSPNGYDDFLAAGAQVSNTVQSQVARGNPSPAQFRTLLADHRDSLRRLRLGLTRECRVPFDASPRGLVELNQFRALTGLLIAEGDLAAADGRYDAAVESYLDAIRFGTELPRGGVLAHSYRGLSSQEKGLYALDRILDRLDAVGRTRLRARLAALDRCCVRAPEAVERQREVGTAMLLDVLRQPDPLTTARGPAGSTAAGPSTPDWREVWELWVTPRSGIIRNFQVYLEQVSSDLEQPYALRPTARPLPDDPICRSLMQCIEQFLQVTAWEHRDFNWRMLDTRLAIEEHRTREGALPATLQELVPDYLRAAPQDPFAPHPLVYKRQGNRYRLYSRGPDGDDDGGKDLPGYVARNQDGDLVTLRNR